MNGQTPRVCFLQIGHLKLQFQNTTEDGLFTVAHDGTIHNAAAVSRPV